MSRPNTSKLIKGREIASDEWQIGAVADATQDAVHDGVSPAPTGASDKRVALPLAQWLEQRSVLIDKKQCGGGALGVWLSPTDDPAALADDLDHLDLVAVQFPKFVDGRGYSTAALLRQRFGYRGELRAFGDIGRDQLFYLSRVGFDAFLLPDGRDAHAALASLNDFPQVYQTAWDQALPLFRRRETSEVA
jgi:uncharacterized protein (DUF934 family)